MHWQDMAVIKHGDCRLLGRNFTELVYADPGTYSGIDEDPTFDADDELVFMARHLGDKHSGGPRPVGTLADLEVEIEVVDPAFGLSSQGFLYLYISDGSLQPDASSSLVDYDFHLLKTNSEGSNDYFDVYVFDCLENEIGWECTDDEAMNPENTWLKTPYYERHYSENWISDELRILDQYSTNQSFLDTQDFQFFRGDCIRYDGTFVKGKSGFVANKNGPVRAIRSWVGANSGTLARREVVSYEQREDQYTWLRVHTIPGVWDYTVYKEGTPLMYLNEANPQGFPIDGEIDEGFDDTYVDWELIQGDTGTYVRTSSLDYNLYENSSISNLEQMWFYDNSHPNCTDCGSRGSPVFENNWNMCSALVTNQVAAWGTHGIKSKSGLPVENTDPTHYYTYEDLPQEACNIVQEPFLYYLNLVYYQYYLSPNLPFTLDTGRKYNVNSKSPLIRL